MDSRFFVLLIVAVVVACQVVRALPHAKPPLADISPTVSTTQSRSFSAQRSIVENSSSDASLRNTDNSITQQIAAGNNLEVGKCWPPDERIYTDNTVVENGGASTLNGTLEIYIDAPIRITCIRIEDRITDGTGATVWIHSGGLGESWVFVGVQAKYSKGFNFDIHIFGIAADGKTS